MKKPKIKQTAKSLLKKHKLDNWKFKFNNSRAYLGLCDYKIKTIFVSNRHYKTLKNSEVKHVLLHEVTHAKLNCRPISLIFLPHGNPFWNKFKELGGKFDCLEVRLHKIYDYIVLSYRLPLFILTFPFVILWAMICIVLNRLSGNIIKLPKALNS